LKYSVVRRSGALTIAFVVGQAINYALVLAANHLLDAGGFGLFYTSLLIINVLFAPMMAVMLVITRQLAEAEAIQGRSQVVALTWSIIAACLRGAPFVALIGVLLAAVALLLGFEAWQLALLIPLIVLAVVLTETLRASFQGMLLFGWQSAIWIVTTAAQFVLAISALWLFPRVWVGIAGILGGTIIAFAIFLPWFVRAARPAPRISVSPITLDLRKELPMIIGYSLFMLLNNSDILVGFWLMPRNALDVYAASAVLPKAIIIATLAVAQVVVPVIVKQKADGYSYRTSIAKGLGSAIGLSLAATAALWIVVPWLQSTKLSIHGLDFAVMMTLAVGAVALGAVRVVVVTEIALHRYAAGLAQGGAILLFVLVTSAWATTPLKLANYYVLLSWGFLLLIAAASVLPRPALLEFFQSPVK